MPEPWFLSSSNLSCVSLPSLLCGREGSSEAGAPPAHSPDPPLSALFLGGMHSSGSKDPCLLGNELKIRMCLYEFSREK